jgi:ABC-type antimicrobial peptide transport system permease subunit
VIFRRLTPMAFIDASPSFVFSKFPSVTFQNSLVAWPTLKRLCGSKLRSVADLPASSVHIALDDGLDDKAIDTVVKELNSYGRSMGAYSVDDVRDEIEPVMETAALLDVFFSIITVVAMVLCFFSLSTSMATNISEQTKEIAILRAVGITRPMLLRIYVYEAFTIVVTASLLGVITGVIVGWTMSLQRSLFTLRPIAFHLPTTTLIVVLVASVVVAVLSSYGPASRVAKRPIVEVMREVS